MHAGMRFRSELLHCLEKVPGAACPLSAAASDLAAAVVDATDSALREMAAGADATADTAGRGRGTSPGVGVVEKSVGDYVTALDLELDRHLTRRLRTIDGLPIVSEEGPAPDDLHALAAAWLVDPLDGTTASLCGETGLCGPMVARLAHGVPQLAVMLSLDGTTLGIAERGRGAVVLRVEFGGGDWISAADFAAIATLKEGCVLFNPQSDAGRSHPAFAALHAVLRTGRHTMAIESRMPHSMAGLGLGAHRRLAVVHDNSAEFPKQMAWDVLPVQLWVEERGGVFWGIDGRPYDIRRPMPIIAATRADIAGRLVELAGAGGA